MRRRRDSLTPLSVPVVTTPIRDNYVAPEPVTMIRSAAEVAIQFVRAQLGLKHDDPER